MTDITLTGNLTADPELRFTPQGKPCASLQVAVNKRAKQPDGSWGDGPTSYYRCTAWGQLAEHVAESLAKGARVIVQGRLEIREYETRDGQRRVAAEIQVDDIGPSLRFATAQPERAPRQGAGWPTQAPPVTPRASQAGDPWSPPQQQPAQDPWGQQTGADDAPPF